MREKWQKQMPLMAHIMNHPQSQELETFSAIIDANPTICMHVLQDLSSAQNPRLILCKVPRLGKFAQKKPGRRKLPGLAA